MAASEVRLQWDPDHDPHGRPLARRALQLGLRGEALTSRALRAACDEASPTVLQARLSDLREAGFVALAAEGGYSLTPLGQELCETFLPLHQFAERWREVRVD